MIAVLEPPIAAPEKPQTKDRLEELQQTVSASRLGLGSFGMRAPVLEHFRRITDSDTQYRLISPRAAAAANDATAGCGDEEAD